MINSKESKKINLFINLIAEVRFVGYYLVKFATELLILCCCGRSYEFADSPNSQSILDQISVKIIYAIV